MHKHAFTMCAIALLAIAAKAQTLAVHSGNTDPTAEGWTAVPGEHTYYAPSTGSGVVAWNISDPTNLPDSGWGYRVDLTPQQEAKASSKGWILRACMRVGDPNSDHSIAVILDTPTRRYDMWFALGNNIDTSVRLATSFPNTCGGVHGPVYTTTAGSCHAPGFHLFDLRYNPISQSCTLMIDGALVHSGYTGHTFGLNQTPGVYFGAGSSCGNGAADFNHVVFVIRCLADYDDDAFVTGNDYDLFVQDFEAGSVNADFDGDGFMSGLDFDLFVQEFEQGC